MKFVIQRVKEASVKVDDEYTGKIKKGYLQYIQIHLNIFLPGEKTHSKKQLI